MLLPPCTVTYLIIITSSVPNFKFVAVTLNERKLVAAEEYATQAKAWRAANPKDSRTYDQYVKDLCVHLHWQRFKLKLFSLLANYRRAFYRFKNMRADWSVCTFCNLNI